MRTRKTKSERVFYERLISAGANFKTQVILGNYILDFVLPDQMICVEVDGPDHSGKKRRAFDDARTAFIEYAGFKVVRVLNDEVENYPIDTLLAMPRQSKFTFERACKRGVSARGMINLGRSNLPTPFQSALFEERQ